MAYAAALLFFDEERGPFVPFAVTQTADVLWMACVISINRFTPFEPPLKMTMAVVEAEESAALRAAASQASGRRRVQPSIPPPPGPTPASMTAWSLSTSAIVRKAGRASGGTRTHVRASPAR